MADYEIKNIYQGGYSSLKPEYGNFVGYRMGAGNFGMSTDARTANILKDVSKNLSAGAKHVELTQVSPEVFESVPKQQLKELNRLSKLTGVEISVHAPVLEPSGFNREGRFSEEDRKNVERQMFQAVERSHEINPTGNIPVTFHSSAGLPGEISQKGEAINETFVIDSEKGSMHKFPIKERNFPGEGEKSIGKELEEINKEQWSEKIRTINYYADLGGERLHYLETAAALAEKKAGKHTDEEERIISSSRHGAAYLNDSYRQLKDLFELANKYGSHEDKEKLIKFRKEIEPIAIEIKKDPKNYFHNAPLMKKIIDKGVETFNEFKSYPEIFKPLNEFSKEKTVETFSNIALESYKKFKDKSPIISIENPPAGGAFSTGTELKELVEKSREKFVEKAVEKGFGKSEAEDAAKKLIGATWDVGHINMLRKFGYESKDIIAHSEQIAPLVKHVHLSDNFGFEHTELPMGMGNVPVKEIMQKLEKEGFKGKKVIEALSWWQHFSEQGATPPLQPTLEAFGSPMSSVGGMPYWNQSVGFQQGYFGGYGQMLPQMNYETFGAGFSTLPSELGGQRPSAGGSRMSGRPME